MNAHRSDADLRRRADSTEEAAPLPATFAYASSADYVQCCRQWYAAVWSMHMMQVGRFVSCFLVYLRQKSSNSIFEEKLHELDARFTLFYATRAGERNVRAINVIA